MEFDTYLDALQYVKEAGLIFYEITVIIKDFKMKFKVIEIDPMI